MTQAEFDQVKARIITKVARKGAIPVRKNVWIQSINIVTNACWIFDVKEVAFGIPMVHRNVNLIDRYGEKVSNDFLFAKNEPSKGCQELDN